MYNKKSRRWEPAIVAGHGDTPRSFIVERLSGGIPLKRNRVHLRPSVEDWSRQRRGGDDDSDIDVTEDEEQPVPVVQQNSAGVEDTTVMPEEANVRRSNRIRKQTDFYQAGGR